MSKHLVIVESAGKIKKIGEYLGSDYIVKASFGHCMDLDPITLSIDAETIKSGIKFDFPRVSVPGPPRVVSPVGVIALIVPVINCVPETIFFKSKIAIPLS